MATLSGTRLDIAGADISLVPGSFRNPQELFRRIDAEADWRRESIKLFGRTHAMPRLTCWMGDVAYRYSGLTHPPAPFTPAIREVLDSVQRQSGTRFNGVLLNQYRDGRDSMGWHADDEASLGAAPVIASVSLGGMRRMRFKPKPHFAAEPFALDLPSGSLLIMRGATQANWLHAIPKSAKPVAVRINLTFRMVNSEV